MFNFKKILAMLVGIIQAIVLAIWVTWVSICLFALKLFLLGGEIESVQRSIGSLLFTLFLLIISDLIYLVQLIAIVMILIFLIKYLRNIKLFKKDYIIFIIALLIEIIIIGCSFWIFIKETT